MALRDRFAPWHFLVVAAFLVGAAGSLFRSGVERFAPLPVLSGLLWAFAVYVFVGTFRNYVSSYTETGDRCGTRASSPRSSSSRSRRPRCSAGD